jgi:hypothetical protein
MDVQPWFSSLLTFLSDRSVTREGLRLPRSSRPMDALPKANADAERLRREIAILRDRMLAVHYYEESHWLAAAVAFPDLCQTPLAQDALRHAATIAWQFGYPAVSHWIYTDVLVHVKQDHTGQSGGITATGRPVRLPPAPDFA